MAMVGFLCSVPDLGSYVFYTQRNGVLDTRMREIHKYGSKSSHS